MKLLPSSDNDPEDPINLSLVELFIQAIMDPHSYNPLLNKYFWFGIFWGIPVPVASVWFHYQFESLPLSEMFHSQPVHYFFLAHPLLFGILFGVMGSMNRHYTERLREESIRDGLTGLYNHRYFRQALKRRIGESERYDLSFCLVMLDLDHFKKVNDNHGHQKGDYVLGSIGNLLEQTTRGSDILSRYGGEEFAVILPETELSEAYELAERIRQKVEEHDFGLKEKLNLTISGGVSQYPADGNSTTDIIQRADERLYQAKESGRNKIFINDTEPNKKIS